MYAGVFHRVMRIDVQITFGLNVQIKQAVASNLFQHVIQKGNTCVEVFLASAVQIDLD